MKVRVFAPAKINLTLEVGRPRADGLHPLQGLVGFADIGDWIEAAPGASLSLDLNGRFAAYLPADDSNLVLRAARALAREAGLERPQAALTLTKDLPVASGMGGGSSDAAAALKALNRLWQLGLDERRLIEVARGLGADVAICVAASNAYMTGIGQTFAPMFLPSLHAVLVNPGKPLSTAEVYRRFDAMQLGGAFTERPAPHWSSAEAVFAGLAASRNDLAAPARALMPEIGQAAALLEAGAGVRHVAVTGSGATVFALLESDAAANALAASIVSERTDWWVRATRIGARA